MNDARDQAADEAPVPSTVGGRLAWYWLPALAMMATIFIISGTPNLDVIPGGVSDKVGHFTGYAVLGALVLRALARADWRGVTVRNLALAWGITALYGASDEFHQVFVPGRFAGADDWLADALGAAAALVVLAVVAYGHRLEGRRV